MGILKRLIAIPLLLVAISGCGQTPEEPKVSSTSNSLLIAVGGANELSVTVNRETLKKKTNDEWQEVTVELQNLPEGLKTAGESTIVLKKEIDEKSKEPKEKQTAKFSFTAAANAKPVVNHKARVITKASGLTEKLDVMITIRDFSLSSGWIVMLISVGTVLALVSFCLIRVFTLPPVEVEETLQGPTTIDLPDTDDPD